MMEKQKIEVIVTKHQWVRGEISLSSEEKEDYENDTENETDLN